MSLETGPEILQKTWHATRFIRISINNIEVLKKNWSMPWIKHTMMHMSNDKKSFWSTIPGILTGLAALITAIISIWHSIPVPEIGSFNADPEYIIEGNSANLSWRVSNAGSVSIDSSNATNAGASIDPGEHPEVNHGTCRVSPKLNTTYTIIAKKWGKESESKEFKVKVLPRDVEELLEAIGTYSPTNPKAGEDITFNASQSKGNIIKYEWEFADGSQKFGSQVYHKYSKGGSYRVKLTVTNNQGAKSSSPIEVKIIGEPPEAIGTYSPANPKAGEEITFDASQSKGNIIKYEWEFGDGFSNFGRKVIHKYQESGTYTLNLTVENDEGQYNSSFIDIIIVEPPHTITLKHEGLYLGKFFVTWDELDALNNTVKKYWSTGSWKPKGYKDEVMLPGNAKNIEVKGQCQTGILWDPHNEISKHYPNGLDSDKTVTIGGTTYSMTIKG